MKILPFFTVCVRAFILAMTMLNFQSLLAQNIKLHHYYNSSSSFSDIHRQSTVNANNQDITFCGYTTDRSSITLLENTIIDYAFPTLVKINYDGSVKLNSSATPYKYYYDLSSMVYTDTVYRHYPADYKAITEYQSNGDYYAVGNFKSAQNLFITRTDFSTGLITSSIGIQGTKFHKLIPTKIFEHNNEIYCIGYAQHSFLNNEVKLFILKVDLSLSTINFFSEFYYSVNPSGGFSKEMIYPLDAMIFYNSTTQQNELAIIGETTDIKEVYGASFDHSAAFFLRFDINLNQVIEINIYPYVFTTSPLTVEDTYSQTFLHLANQSSGASEFYIAGMITVTLSDKAAFLLHIDEMGNVLSQDHFEESNYIGSSLKLYPTRIIYDPNNERLLFSVHAFIGSYQSVDANSINFNTSRTLKWEFDLAGAGIINPRKYFTSSSHSRGTSLFYDITNDAVQLCGSGLYSSDINQLSIYDNYNIGCEIEIDTVSSIQLNIEGYHSSYPSEKQFVVNNDYHIVPLDLDLLDLNSSLLCNEVGEDPSMRGFWNSGKSNKQHYYSDSKSTKYNVSDISYSIHRINGIEIVNGVIFVNPESTAEEVNKEIIHSNQGLSSGFYFIKFSMNNKLYYSKIMVLSE